MTARGARWRVLSVVATVALAIAACGGGGDDGGAAGDATTEGAADDATAPAAGGASGEVSIVTTWTGSEGEAFQAVIDGFEESNPDVTVEIVQVPFGELNAQLTQQFAAGDPPDVATVFPGLIRLFAAEGFLAPVDDLWDAWIDEGAYTESLRDVASHEGTAYGVWFKGNVNGLIWHRTALLDDLGVATPETWDDFTALLDEAGASGIDAVTIGGADGWPLTQWSDAVLASVAGPEVFTGLQQGTVSWDDPRVVEAFEVFGQLIADHFPDTALDRGFVDATCAWVDGQAAVQNQGAFVSLVAPGECDDSLVPGEDFTFFRMPDFDESLPARQFISGDLFAVSEDSANPDAARELVRYLGSAEAQTVWAERGGFVAPNAGVSPDAYPTDLDRQAAALFPTDPETAALYDLDDFIGGEIQATERQALQQFVRDQDVDAFVATMLEVDERVRG